MSVSRWLSAERRRWLWPLCIAALILMASSRSAVAGPKVPHFDKVVHFSVYGLLGTLSCRVGKGRAGAWWALAAVSAYGATDEWHQSFVPGRYAELEDWIADTAGAAVAILLYRRWSSYRALLEWELGGRAAAEAPPTAR